MKLPGRDYPIGPMTAEELEIDAARIVREVKQTKLGVQGTAEFNRRRKKRANALYGALLAKTTAKWMRKRDVRLAEELRPRDRKKVLAETDKHASRGTHIEDIY